MFRCQQILVFLTLLFQTKAQPRFEVFWESSVSYQYVDEKQYNPWYINIGDFDTGGLGYIGGPNVVTVRGADFCVEGCQENYPDEFCGKYPPEGIPFKPRTVEDWGTKSNITSEVLAKGIADIHAKGGKVILSYGYIPVQWDSVGNWRGLGHGGISAQNGGGDQYMEEIPGNAAKFAARVKKNVEDWNFDGVDFFYLYQDDKQYWDDSCPGHCQDYPPTYGERWNQPGRSVEYNSRVIREVRAALGSSKTISLTSLGNFELGTNNGEYSYKMEMTNNVIVASHPYLDYITVAVDANSRQGAREQLQSFGISLNKVGFLLDINSQSQYWPSNDVVEDIINEVKSYRMAGLSLYTINMENNAMRGNFARMVAELMYF